MNEAAAASQTRGEILPIDHLVAEPVRSGVQLWRQLKGGRRFPGRPSMMSALAAPLRDNSFLVEVLNGGADYEYREVGAALVKGFDVDFSGRRLSEIIETAPKFGLGLRMLYEMVRAGGEPLGYRGWVGDDLPGAAFIHHENAILPLGGGAGEGREDAGGVDHLLVVSMLVLRRAATA